MTDFAQALYGDTTPAATPQVQTPSMTAADRLYAPAAETVQAAKPTPTPVAAKPAPTPAPVAAKPAPAPAQPAETTATPAPAAAEPAADDTNTSTEGAADDAPAVEITVDAIKAAIPKEVLKAREADGARKLFGNAAELAEVLPDSAFEGDGISSEVAAVLGGEVRAMAGDMGLDIVDVDQFRGALAEVRESPPTDEQRVANREQIVAALNEAYGEQAYRAWLDARAYVAVDPRRAALLAPIGDSPEVVLRVVELARQARRDGKLNATTTTAKKGKK